MSQKDVIVQQVNRDRYSRSGILKVGSKQLLTPNFCSRIKSENDFKIFLETSTLYPLTNCNSIVMRISDSPDVILPKISNIRQRKLDSDNSYTDQKYRDFYKNNVILIDPASEFLFYEDEGILLSNLKRITKDAGYLSNVISFLEQKKQYKNRSSGKKYDNWKMRAYNKFWYDLDRDKKGLAQTMGEVQDIEERFKADLFIPFVPVINSRGLFDISMRINKLGSAISRMNFATYLILQKSVLSDTEFMGEIINYLTEDSSKYTIIKIKNTSLWEPGNMVQRENYRQLMKRMSEITKINLNKAFFLLEGGYQCYPSASVSFDVVSSTLTGLDLDLKGGSNSRGNWYHPKLLYNILFDDYSTSYKHNNKTSICDCPACVSINNIDIDNIPMQEWNNVRREHYLFTMDSKMKNIVNLIKQNRIDLIKQEILQSEISKLIEIIPDF